MTLVSAMQRIVEQFVRHYTERIQSMHVSTESFQYESRTNNTLTQTSHPNQLYFRVWERLHINIEQSVAALKNLSLFHVILQEFIKVSKLI